MAKLNWQKINDQKAIDYARRNNDCYKGVKKKSYKINKITNSQKKLIAKLLRQHGIEWSNEINSISFYEASELIKSLKSLEL